ncbi:hypothetical protein CPB86DRAFT_829874 [Serendipita vermifera]|nr:hypothetical protein CPB86DRAFT_829874 [Serendipita vermifera]
MDKSATNAVAKASAAARLATGRANLTKGPREINESIAQWETVAQMIDSCNSSEDQADILTSYAGSLLLRWDLSHNTDDIQLIISNLEIALEKLPYASTRARYDLLIRLGKVHESWYHNLKNNPDALSRAIQYWEDAYGLSAILRCMKESANEILPTLAKACFISFKDELSSIDSLHQAIHYYQMALVHIRPELHAQLRLALGKVYLELMYYTNEVENARSAIECFEVVLKNSNKEEELIEASNGKSQGWWWKLATEETRKFYEEDEEFPFRAWTRSVATTYRKNGIAVCYYALSSVWIEGGGKNQLVWFHLAWSLLRSARQSPPPGFHYIYSRMLYLSHLRKSYPSDAAFGDLPILLSALEQLGMMIPATWKPLRQTHPSLLDSSQWSAWKRKSINVVLTLRRTYLEAVTKMCGNDDPIDPNAVVESEDDLKAQLQVRIIKPKNFN